MKYTTVKISGIITQIAEETNYNTNIKGYTIGIIESLLPSDEETVNWTEKMAKHWTTKNNKRMKGICDFLNLQHQNNIPGF